MPAVAGYSGEVMPHNPIERFRIAVVSRTVGLFAHADDPMANTLDHAGDPGLFGPGSISWEVMGDVSGFIGGIRGTDELVRLVDSGRAAVAFSLHATTIDDLLTVADAGEIMPPKSTWFEPKLRDGLVSHVIDTGAIGSGEEER